jgi:hypothetical protein
LKHVKHRIRSGLVVGVASLAAACGGRACGKANVVERNAAFDGDQAALVARNPRGLLFVLRTENDQRRFAMGEKIPLVLRFSSSVPDIYELDVGTWDNSGRLESELFHFDPSPVIDPLAHYFDNGRTGGGLRPRPVVLGTPPTELTITLNEWARFVAPGTYRVFVESTRTQRSTSDILTLEIVDDPKWAAAELTRAVSVLAAKETTQEGALEARRSLRFLSTRGAGKAMADDLCGADERNRFQTELGLFASPFRPEVLTLLEAGLEAPECAISSSYLSTLARLSERDGGRDEHERVFLANVEKKKGPALAVSLRTALQIVDRREQHDRKPDPMRDELRARIAGVLTSLPEDALASLLEREWSNVRSAAMAPMLLGLAKEARPRGGRLRSISDLALERLVELDYESARAFILSELGRPDGVRVSFTGKTLGLLKDDELPGVDAALVGGLASERHDGATLELRSEVVARYGSKAILDKVWSFYRASKYFRVSLLAYLWRHDRAGAEAEMREVDDTESLRRLSEHLWNPGLEARFIERLRAGFTGTAVTVLAERGSAAAEAAIVARWRELHASGTDKNDDAQTLRNHLVRARGWMITPSRARELAELCDTSMCRSDLASLGGRWGADGKQPELVLWSQTDGTLTGWFGHYDVHTLEDLERRIEQLPAGYAIALKSKPPDVEAATIDKVRAWAAKRSIPLVAPP